MGTALAPAAALARSTASARLPVKVNPPPSGCSPGRWVTMKSGTSHGLAPPQCPAAS